ncbi:MAG: hypothetical protein UY60_C0006G0023 [Parcubacteria group bacterium GW2011_GWB1_50_9]|uniref:Uncharacterized protein n=1 Tax=Candidatus Adlerbacteria bacterium GW2011_GWC1_50_9 TaxID=1618608 RepID=A0A0G1WR46_9BACT|nr:MAG: hypothetical protein UY60_C0006G0023 [Parcubacteria group bacterium GW2011_GWB1_50_9]KKW21328.1 MAG: hypothetical protein UY61_C0009G0023 [Candidatus Adlerbacteria bacterium GW2011_GWC1_50_9]
MTKTAQREFPLSRLRVNTCCVSRYRTRRARQTRRENFSFITRIGLVGVNSFLTNSRDGFCSIYIFVAAPPKANVFAFGPSVTSSGESLISLSISGHWESNPALHPPQGCVLPLHYGPILIMDVKVDSREKIGNLFAPSDVCCRYTTARLIHFNIACASFFSFF